jgi:BirA family biotin operon repressor/biotin-[acetyl-CoA-carboxylase] ligase
VSLLVELPQQLGAISPWVLATAWGIAAQLQGARIPVQLKWPNDLLLAEKKLGGIKLETKSLQGSSAPMVIGVGINWSNPVPATGASLEAFCHWQNLPWPDPLPTLTRLVLQGILDGVEVYQNQGIEAILERYHRYFAHGGREIKLEQGWGTILGVTAQGELAVLRRSPGATSRMYFPPGSLQLGYLDSDKGPNHCRDERLDPKGFPPDA